MHPVIYYYSENCTQSFTIIPETCPDELFITPKTAPSYLLLLWKLQPWIIHYSENCTQSFTAIPETCPHELFITPNFAPRHFLFFQKPTLMNYFLLRILHPVIYYYPRNLPWWIIYYSEFCTQSFTIIPETCPDDLFITPEIALTVVRLRIAHTIHATSHSIYKLM